MESIFRDIKLYYEPRRECLNMYEWPSTEPEMTEFESAFLCGLIKQREPRKIVEVGVAAGGTTAIIVKSLELLSLKTQCEVYSVDISEFFYRGKGERCGYLADEVLNESHPNIKHKFLLGKLLPEIIDEIGDNIDFVILDTTHSLPGEILDFLAIYPYLKKNACVVLHDIALNHYGSNPLYAFATQLLFSCVVADKILNTDESRPMRYPNIGAFTINDDTSKHLDDVFNSLLITWESLINDAAFKIYFNHYVRHYGKQTGDFFSMIYKLQKETHETVIRNKKQMVSRQSISYKIGRFVTWIPRKLFNIP